MYDLHGCVVEGSVNAIEENIFGQDQCDDQQHGQPERTISYKISPNLNTNTYSITTQSRQSSTTTHFKPIVVQHGEASDHVGHNDPRQHRQKEDCQDWTVPLVLDEQDLVDHQS